MSTTVIELENKDIVVKMSGQGPIGPRGLQGESGPAGPSEWGVIQGNISDQTDLQNALDAKADVGASYTKSEEDALLAQKADADSVYTKTETDALLADKADTDDVYNKTDVNTLLSGKADADTVYTKTETDALLDAKADVGDSYTKAEEDALLAVKANSADVYTKTETDTLLADKADADDVYTKDEVDDALDLKADSADVYTKTETDDMLLDKAPVILSSASGSIASFTDGSASPVTALSVGIEPVQDLHGYDNPWPAGGGMNKMPPNAASNSQIVNGITLTANNGVYTLKGTASETLNIDCDLLYDAYFSTSYKLCFLNTQAVGAVTLFFMNGNTVVKNWSMGTVNRVVSGWSETQDPAKKIRFNISSGAVVNMTISPMFVSLNESDPTSFAPYENVCPISGHTSATVTRTGKNLFDPNQFAYGKSEYYTVNNDKSITVLKQDVLAWSNITPMTLKAGTYTLSWVTQNSGQLRMKTSEDDYSTEIYITASLSHYTFTLTKDSGIKLKLGIGVSYPYTEYLQLELGSSATAYEPYQGQTVTIDLNGTRYGGTLNVLTGEMTVTKAIVDLGTLIYGRAESSTPGVYRFSTELSDIAPGGNVAIKCICSQYKAYLSSEYSQHDKSIASGTAGRYIYIRDDSYTDATTFKTAMSGVQLVYDLSTPLTVQLTPSQLTTLLGTNHILADTGDTSVEYRADTRMYIDQSLQSQSNALKLMLTPNVETEMKASKNYTSGSIVIVNNDFIKLTSAVASGANLVIGSNCAKTTMAEWVASLTA